MNTKVEQQVECSTCQWDKFCLKPPTMTEAEVKDKVSFKGEKPTDPDDKEAANKSMFGDILNMVVYAGKDKDCIACPTFIARLREGPELSNRIKALMQEA